jgi:hypothetical protein
MQPRQIRGLREVADAFDGVLLDQFGVLHDGRTPYPRAIEAVRQLDAAGKRVVIVSNSSRRSGGTIGKLAKMGFDAEWFTGARPAARGRAGAPAPRQRQPAGACNACIPSLPPPHLPPQPPGAITSGELAHRYLAERPDPWWRALGRRCIHLTWSSRGSISLEGLGLEVVGGPEDDPDFILAHGTEAVAAPMVAAAGGGGQQQAQAPAQDASLEELRALVEACAAAAKRRGKAMPMIVANPGGGGGGGASATPHRAVPHGLQGSLARTRRPFAAARAPRRPAHPPPPPRRPRPLDPRHRHRRRCGRADHDARHAG